MRNKDITCESVLRKYLQDNLVWHKKVHLYAIAEDWSPETVGRTLREMEGIHEDYYKGRFGQKLAMYSINPKEIPKKVTYQIIERDGKRVAVPIYI